ncbi:MULTISPECIES: bile acid:sodium symporter family protein [Halomicrobium]|uniref:Bile acid:sodium symporter n=2 Tax=Halomicrobium mukohataei TaxID=57705 RepID=C7NY93_HALMD|nr:MULTISPECIES: bile acid:sodium symporter [Halomicrobium]ACV48553.1 Bile acid:sodium symporter [Halomicrobium mukohataei DSM 12286]QCD66952.1 Na+-dependent transporter [Halomicrobium mukohataei]QFR21762.1 Na+-dependent transporter [Halomicrobium sp. ZPS1]
MSVTDLIEDYLLLWILLAVGLGIAIPEIAVVTRASTLILAVMIGSVSLTLSVKQFRQIRARTLGLVLVGHVTMPFLAFGVARRLGLSPELTVGFVVLGAATPELVTPVMTELAGGETALSTTALVVIGVGSVGFIPAVVALLVGEVAVPTMPIIEQLIVAVVVPMLAAVCVRAWQPERVGVYDAYYPAISATMVVLIIGGVTAANAATIRLNTGLLTGIGVGVVVLNTLGYGIGFVLSRAGSRSTHIASVLSVGMRDFAIAAALVIAAGLPTIASLPAVAFGVVEMATSAGLAKWYRRTE